MKLALVLLALVYGCGRSTRASDAPRSTTVTLRAELVTSDPAPSVARVEAALMRVAHVHDVSVVMRRHDARVTVQVDNAGEREARAALSSALGRDTRIIQEPPLMTYVVAAQGLDEAQLAAVASHVVATIEETPGAIADVTCESSRLVTWLDVDDRLATSGLTIDDLLASIDTAGPADLPAATIAVVNDVPLHVADVGVMRTEREIAPCRAATSAGPAAIIDVYATVPADALAIRAALATQLRDLHPLVAATRLLVGLNAEGSTDSQGLELRALREAAVDAANGAEVVVEKGGDNAFGNAIIELSGSPAVIDAVEARVRELPFVIGCGEPSFVVELTGGDGDAVRAIAHDLAQRYAARGVLIATRGLAAAPRLVMAVDKSAAASIGARGVDVAIASLEPDGVRASRTRGDDASALRVHAASGAWLMVHADHGLVPLSAVASVHTTLEPIESVRVDGAPTVRVYVSSAQAEIRTILAAAKVPAAVRTAVLAVSR